MRKNIVGSSSRKEVGSVSTMYVVAESLLGASLLNSMISKQRCLENGMTEEAKVFESAIQSTRTTLSEAGLDPDKIIADRIRLLQEAAKKTS